MAWFTSLLLAAAVAAPALASSPARATRLGVRIRDAGMCASPPHQLEVIDFAIRMDETGSEYVVADYLAHKPMTTISKFEIKLTKCTGAVTPSMCEYYATFRWIFGLCALCPAKNMIWSPIVESISPPFKCPLPAGRFHLANGTVDTEQLLAFIDGRIIMAHTWVVEVRLYDEEGGLHHCFNATFNAFPQRRRRRPKRK